MKLLWYLVDLFLKKLTWHSTVVCTLQIYVYRESVGVPNNTVQMYTVSTSSGIAVTVHTMCTILITSCRCRSKRYSIVKTRCRPTLFGKTYW